jgi:hypothetical protein
MTQSDSGMSILELIYNDKKIFYDRMTDGFYDTIMKCNLNNDGILDFLISYAFEDGAMLYGLVSNSKSEFHKTKLFDEWHENYCLQSADTLKHIIPIQVADFTGDGKDEVVINAVRFNRVDFPVSCTDTVFGDRIR